MRARLAVWPTLKTSLYDRDIQLWIEELNSLRYCEVLLRGGARPPSPAELGLIP